MTLLFLLSAIAFFSHAKDAEPHFSPKESGCLIYKDLSDPKQIKTFGHNCKLQTPPCSTFKITLAELGFKNEKLEPKGEIFKWDGKIRNRESLNKDQDLSSWMKDSAVWVSSIVVNRLGQEKIRSELKDLSYGNASIGPDEFWIKGPLSLSVEEQISYLSRTNSKHLERSIQLLPEEKVGALSVKGKTGSCYIGDPQKRQQIGWYIGRVKSADREYAFALRFINEKNSKTDGPAGFRAKELFLKWLPRSN
ncbi:MAG: penicillin-binding transpeptidase domain-containing protein [Pseudobdellovibrionaceae bacterium]